MVSSVDLDLVSSLQNSSDLKQAISRVEKLWSLFHTKHSVPEDHLRPTISNSWQRCLESKVNPYRHTPPQLSPEQVQRRLRDHRPYLEVIRPAIANMEHLADLSRFIIGFADREGFILMIHGNQELRREVDELNFRLGANWSERHAGTNAIGTAIATGQPSQVFHAEHYCRGLHKYTCTAVPIQDPTSRELIGILDFASHAEDHQPHIVGLAIQMGRCIELEIYRKEKEEEDFFRDSSLQLTLDHLERGVIVLDAHDRIRRVNHKALEYLNMKTDAVLNQAFHELAILSEWRDLEKPFTLPHTMGSELCLRRKPLLQQRRLVGTLILIEPIKRASKQVGHRHHPVACVPIGRAASFLSSVQLAENAAQFDSNILILGETGTGKEVLARYIHSKSKRGANPFVALNCGSFPKELLASELFGYEAGAFTGASKKGKPSKFELAYGGTLLLDEISEMPLESQVYLLRVIEDMALTPLGAKQSIPFDVRIIATSNKDLSSEVRAGGFRADLFFRLNIVSIQLSPLRERKEDIPVLAEHFIPVLSKSMGKRVTKITKSALDALVAYDWPGNVRELRNALEQAIVISPGESITWDILPEVVRSEGRIPLHLPDKDRERYLEFVRTYHDANGNITKVAKLLNVSRPTVYSWCKRFGLN
jgi:transcriptional regulator of acetoin/glycerol metabolism